MRGLPDRIGRYEIRSVLGAGGFGTVVAAFDEALDAYVAVKILNVQYADDLPMRERFVQEARLLRRVRSPHVISIHDIGETDEGLPYFVMELADGGVLADRMPTGEVDADGLRDVITSLAAGLSALHAVGIVHRDIKPANLLITGDARAKGDNPSATLIRVGLLGPGERIIIGDLGLAKDSDRTSIHPTIVGGTPQFRAPEQIRRGAAVGPATDVYAATAVVWNLLTGSPPPGRDELTAQLPPAPGRVEVRAQPRPRRESRGALRDRFRLAGRRARRARRGDGHRQDRLPVRGIGSDVPVQGPGVVPGRGCAVLLRSGGGGRRPRPPAPDLVDARHRRTVGQWQVLAPPGRPHPRARAAPCPAASTGRYSSSAPAPTRSTSSRSSSVASIPASLRCRPTPCARILDRPAGSSLPALTCCSRSTSSRSS